MLKKFRPFQTLFKILLIILPFHVLISVFFEFKIGISGFGIYKDILVTLLGLALIYEFFRAKIRPKFDLLDYLVAGYIGYMILISLISGVGLKAIIVGARYDFEFFLVMLFIKHGKQFLQGKLSEYLLLFVYSTGIAIFFGMLVRFVFGETILVHFGFSPRLSVWEQGGSIPIYDGVEGASVRRFQGIFDGPNQAAFLLLGYLGILLHVGYTKKNWHWLLYSAVFVVFGLIFMTYCRSALLGILGGGAVVMTLNIMTIFKKYLKIAAIFFGIIVLFSGLVYLKYGDNVKTIILRGGSSKGHYERMAIGFEEFKNKPLGHGLASSGPAYRTTHDISKISENQYIPESWYVQQLVEGGVLGFLLFISVFVLIALRLYRKSIFIFGSLIGMLVMNAFLHSFEASYASVLIFAIIGLFMEIKDSKMIL